MTRTVTYDETQWKLVPLYIEQNQVDKGVMGYLGCTADKLKKIDPEQLTRYEQLIINAYVDCVNAAPPYPESNFVESLDSWIPVSERLPEKYVEVLAWPYQTDYIMTAQIDNRGWWYGEYNSWGQEKTHTDRITHWMPMPAAPRIKLS